MFMDIISDLLLWYLRNRLGVAFVILLTPIAVVVIKLVVHPLWLSAQTHYRSIAYKYQAINTQACISDKRYCASRTTSIPSSKTSVTISHPAEYLVVLTTRNGLSDIVDDEELYRKLDKGAVVQVTIKIGRNASGQPKHWKITHYSY